MIEEMMTAKKRLYLAGPMRGYPEDNFPEFLRIAAKLRSEGYEVWNPAENDKFEFTFAKAMERDLAEVCKSDSVAVLKGWEKSQGARLETHVARELGKPIICAYTLEVIPYSDFKPTNAKDVAAIGKLDLSLYPDTAVAYGALGMSEGDLKYGGFNYRVGGVLASTYVAALRRHLAKWWNGQDADPKTLVPHLASVNACSAILIDAIEKGCLQDDRPPSVNMEKTYTMLESVLQHLRSIFTNKAKRYTQKG